jgi:predicted O-linked N-acetylglucosamine transferase (SPINDLY family)
MTLPTAVSRSAEAAAPDGVRALFQRALLCQRQGETAQAEELYQRILAVQPAHAPTLHLLGSMALQRGAVQRACELIGQSLAANATVAVVHVDLGNALQLAGRGPAALASYDRALELEPDLFAAHFNRAVTLQELQRPTEALACYERTLELKPSFVTALYNRAVLLAALHRPAEALTAYDRCLKAAPNHAEALSNRGALLMELKRPEEALSSLERALLLAPDLVKALNNRGNTLQSLRRFEEAVASFDRALAIEPRFIEALRNRGCALRKMGLAEAALASFDEALRLRPSHPATMLDRAEALIDLNRYAQAIACLTQTIEQAPDTDYARGLRAHLQGLACNWQDREHRRRDLIESVNAGRRADYPFPFLSVTDSAEAQAQCARTFVADKFPESPTPLWRGKRYRHQKIRVAYLSGDLRQHPVSALLVRVFEKHDRRRFDTIAISLRPAEQSSLGRRVRAAFDSFVDVSQMSDRAVAALLCERQVDIAVDLMGFTQGSRTGILAHRAAPVQVNYLGFPGTMGAPYIDYLIADEFLIPAERSRHYCEKIAWLPECFQANDDQRPISHHAPPRRQFGLPDFGLVFCCFNNAYKITPTMFDIWMRLLLAVPASVLWLVAENVEVQSNLRGEARHRGVDPMRLVFADRIPYADHLARIRCADLFLDTLPFNAGTTASDALWAGVPLVTCAGDALAGRMAGSLLTGVGLPELITDSLDAYEALALDLALSASRLADIRSRLASNRLTSPLFDSGRFCRHLESAYVSMWERSECGKAPQSFVVPPRARAG